MRLFCIDNSWCQNVVRTKSGSKAVRLDRQKHNKNKSNKTVQLHIPQLAIAAKLVALSLARSVWPSKQTSIQVTRPPPGNQHCRPAKKNTISNSQSPGTMTMIKGLKLKWELFKRTLAQRRRQTDRTWTRGSRSLYLFNKELVLVA